MEKYLAGRYALKNKSHQSRVQSYMDMNIVNTHALSDMGWRLWGGGGAASPSNSRNNIILPFTVARVIDEDEERLSCGSLHQLLFVPAAPVKQQCADGPRVRRSNEPDTQAASGW